MDSFATYSHKSFYSKASLDGSSRLLVIAPAGCHLRAAPPTTLLLTTTITVEARAGVLGVIFGQGNDELHSFWLLLAYDTCRSPWWGVRIAEEDHEHCSKSEIKC